MRVLKFIGSLLLSLVGVVVILTLALGFVGGRKENARYSVSDSVLVAAASADPAAIARGEHWSRILGCTDCHAADLSGEVKVDAPPFRAVASNLTSGSGGVGASYGPKDWDRAIRYGVGPDGSAVQFMMPSKLYHGLSDADAADLVAYLVSIPPVDNVLPRSELRMLGRIIAGAGGLDPALAVSSADRTRAAAPERRGVTPESGRYLASVTCVECHGEDLRGAKHPDPSGLPGPSLEAAAGWSADQFRLAVAAGVMPDGRTLDPKWMPWQAFAHMTDEEVEAVRLYVRKTFR